RRDRACQNPEMVEFERLAMGAPLARGRIQAQAARRAKPRVDQLAALYGRPGAARAQRRCDPKNPGRKCAESRTGELRRLKPVPKKWITLMLSPHSPALCTT